MDVLDHVVFAAARGGAKNSQCSIVIAIQTNNLHECVLTQNDPRKHFHYTWSNSRDLDKCRSSVLGHLTLAHVSERPVRSPASIVRELRLVEKVMTS